MIEITKYKPVGKNSLAAIFSIKIPKWGNFFIRDMCLFKKGNQKWVSFPSKMYEENGEKKYIQFNGFEDIKTLQSFQDHILMALENYLKQNEVP